MAMLTGLEWIPVWLLVIALIWSIIWKGIALWQSARGSQKIWFVVLLITNTLGILEILYLLFWQKEKREVKKAKAKRKRR
jgi:methionyl-tRNA synthetase